MVKVTLGKDKGRSGKIEKIFPKEGKVQVTGINMFKKHMKRKDEKTPGGITDITRPISVAKIALICPSCGKPTRIGFVVSKNDKVRVCRKCGKKI